MCAMSPRLLRPLASGAFSPRQIAGLSAWYDASVASSLTLTSGFVSQWDDLSGSGLHLTQAVEANRPGTGTIDGKTAVHFDGSNDVMLVSANVFPGTLIALCSLDNPGPTPYLLAGAVDGTQANSVNVEWNFPGEWILDGLEAGSLYSSSGGQAVADQPTIATALYGSGNTSRINGASLPGTNVGAPAAVPSSIILGARKVSGPGRRHLDGKIGEVLLFNRVLTTSEVQKVERYLASKWGVTLA